MTKDRVIITGATGRLGQVVVQQLASRYDLTAIVRTVPDARLPITIDQLACDLEDTETLTAALSRAQQCVMILPDHPRAASMAAALTQAAERSGIRQLIKLSAHLASQIPPLSFGIEHAEADAHVAASPIDSVIFRPAMFMQSLALFLGELHKGRMVVPVPTGKVALIDAYDIAAAIEAALDGHVAPGTYMLTGPEALSFKDIAAALSQWTGAGLKHIAPPRWIAGIAMRFDSNLDTFNRARLLQFLKALEAGLEAPIYPDTQTILGRPGRSLKDLLAAMPSYSGAAPIFHERTR